MIDSGVYEGPESRDELDAEYTSLRAELDTKEARGSAYAEAAKEFRMMGGGIMDVFYRDAERSVVAGIAPDELPLKRHVAQLINLQAATALANELGEIA